MAAGSEPKVAMRSETRAFGALAVFFAASTLVYWYTSHEPTGTVCLFVTFLFSGLVTYFLWYTGHHVPPRTEDREDADMAEGAGELGFFPPQSYFPVFIAGGFAVAFLGLIFGLWLTILGAPIVMFGAFGLLFEHYAHE